MRIGMAMMMMLEVGMLGDLLTFTSISCLICVTYWLFCFSCFAVALEVETEHLGG
jgi:hypothetical protein